MLVSGTGAGAEPPEPSDLTKIVLTGAEIKTFVLLITAK
jgi:hypothetical protein